MTDSTIKHIAIVFLVNAEALKPDLKVPRRRSIIRVFSLNTWTHGIPSIARSQSIYNRIFWTVSFVAFTGIMIYFITEAMRAYFVYVQNFMQYKLNNNESLKEYFFALNIMLMYCNFNGIPCTAEDFTPFLSPYYSLCYTFNARNDQIRNGTLFNTNDNGQSGLLGLQFYIHSQQSVPYYSDVMTIFRKLFTINSMNFPAAGIITMVHDNRDMPLVNLQGIYLAPGQKHRITYSRKKQFDLGAPYSDCSDDVPFILKANEKNFGGTDYAY